MPVVLWTDGLLFLLLAALLLYAVQVLRNAHLRGPWRHVAANGLAMASAVILAVFLVIAVLDSVHYYPREGPAGDPGLRAGQMVSLLDRLLTPLRSRVEKSYSAPFALYLSAREARIRDDGRQVREQVRLSHGGAHLADTGQRAGDIAVRSGAALRNAALGTIVAVVLLCGGLAIRHRRSPPDVVRDLFAGRYATAWRPALASLAVVLAVLCLGLELAPRYHVFGTDKVGQDVLYIALKSVRTGLLIGTLTTFVMLPFALLLGVMAGYFRGWADDLIQYLYTTLNSIPAVLLIAAAILVLQVHMAAHPGNFDSLEQRADLRLLFLCLILGVTSWTGLCRLLRGESLKLAQVDYIQVARALGVGHWRIITRHIVPNVMHIVLIAVVLDFSTLVLAEAVLSYVNIGVDPATNSWGNMINSARLELAREPVVWWSLGAAFMFMFLLVLAANLFADAVRDAFDPRLHVAVGH